MLTFVLAQAVSPAFDWLHVVLGLLVVVGTPLAGKLGHWLASKVDPEELVVAKKMVLAVIQGVEAGDHDETKAAVQQASVAAGVATQLDAIVQKATGGAP